MSDRTKGLLNISANFEVQSAEGLDSRCRVKTRASLILLDTWKSTDNNAYTYVGMLVSVYEDSEINNGVYRLKDSDYSIMDNWKKVSGDPFGNSGELQLNSGGTLYSTSSLTYDFDNNILKVPTISALTYYGDGSNLTGLVATLSGLTDVQLNNLVTGEILIYSGNSWKNNTLDFNYISNKPTTISGYGITDATLLSDFNSYTANTYDILTSMTYNFDYYTGTTIPTILNDYYTSAQTNSNFLSANTFSSVINTNGINNVGNLTSTTSYNGDLYITNTPISNTALTNLLVRDSDGSIKVRSVTSVLPNTVYEGVFYVSKPIYPSAATYSQTSGCSATIIGTGVTDITSTDSTYNTQLSIATMGNANKPYPCPYSARNDAMTAIQNGVIKNALIIVLNGNFTIGSNQIAQNGTEDHGSSSNQQPDLMFWQSRSTSISSLYQDKIDYHFYKNTKFTYICKSFPIYFGYNVDSNDTIFNSNIYGEGRFLQVYGEGNHNSKFMYIDNANANIEFNANYTSFSQYNTFQFINYENINIGIKTLKSSDTRLFEFSSTREGSGTPSRLNVNIEYAQWGKGLSDYADNADWWETISLIGAGTNRYKFIDFYIKKLRMNQGPYGIWRNAGQPELNVNVNFNIDELYQTDDQIFTGSLANRLGLIAPSWGAYSGIVSASTYIFNIGNAVTDLALFSTNTHFDKYSATDVYFELNVGSHTKNQNSNSGRLKGNIIVGGNLDNSAYGSGKSTFRFNGRFKNTQGEVITHDNTYASSVNQRHYFNGIFETTTGVEPINMALINDHNIYFQNVTLTNSATTSFKSNTYNSLSIGGNLSVVIGGSGITSYSANTVYVPYLNLSNANTGSTSNNILVRNGGGQIEIRDVSTILTTGLSWSVIYNTPTTLSGYSITDAYTTAQTYTRSEMDTRYVNVTGDTMTGTLYGTAFSATTISGSSYYGNYVTLLSTVSGNTVLNVQGTQGQLFSVTDSLDGSLLSVNDISGYPILEVFSDKTTIIGDYLAPSLYATKNMIIGTGTTTIYSIVSSAYTGAFYDYIITGNVGMRSGSITAIWSGSTVHYSEMSTSSFGVTNAITFSVVISGNNVNLNTSASVTDYNVKTIIRSI